jgi:hypothetical protein
MKFGDRSYWNTETYESSNKHNVSVLYAKSSKRNNSIIKEMTEASLLKRHLQYIETYTKIKVSNQDSNIAISNDAIHSSNGISFEVNRTFRSLSLIYNNQSELCILSSKGEKINPEKIFVGKTFCKQKMINEISSFVGHKYFLKPNLIVLKKNKLVHSDDDTVKNCNIKFFTSLTMTNVTNKEDIMLHGFPMERHKVSMNADNQTNSFIVIEPNTYGIINYMFNYTVVNKDGIYEYKYGASVMLLKKDTAVSDDHNKYPFKRYLWDICDGKIREKTISLHCNFLDICFGFKFAKDDYRIVNLANPDITNDYFILVPHTFFKKPEFQRIKNKDVFSTKEDQYWLRRVG